MRELRSMKKYEWYRNALRSLGPQSLFRLQVQKRSFSTSSVKLTAKTLRFPLLARPGTSDFMVFDQIFVEREYWPLDRLEDVGLVIDCGANVGYSSAYFLSTHPKSFVVAVEPESDNYHLLLTNLLPYSSRCTAIQAAVWSKHETIALRRKDEPGMEWGHRIEKAGQEDIALTSVTIPELIQMSGYERVSILKIDIEGAEMQLFSENTEWLELVDNIVIELHGPECSNTFLSAIDKKRFDVSVSGELTVCLKRR
jgi:FkbM family methyltransferase